MYFIKDQNFAYSGVDYTYHSTYPHNDDPGLCVIEEATATTVSVDQIAAHLAGTKSTTINQYLIDRILRLNKVYLPEVWDVRICPGYYGDEIDGVYLREGIASVVDTMIASVIYLQNDNFKVEELLRLEYGFLLPELEGRDWAVEKIDRQWIKYGNHDYGKRLDPAAVGVYEDYKGIRGIVIPKDDGYRLIDGYHRCYNATGTVRVLVGRLPCESKPATTTSSTHPETAPSGSSKKNTGTTKSESTTARSTANSTRSSRRGSKK
jgi:hypothetical protein